MNEVRLMTNSRKLLIEATRSSAERLSIATRLGLKASISCLHRDQVVLERGRLGVDADQLEPAVGLHGLEVDAPAQGVAEELVAALLEGEEQRALAGLGPAADELGGQQRLAGPRGAGDQDDRVAEEAAAAHHVQLGDARADPDVRRPLPQLDGRERQDDDPLPSRDREGELPLLVRGARGT